MLAFVRRVALATGIAAGVASVLEWRRRRLAGEAPFDRLRIFMNQRVNPWLLGRGLATGPRAEIGTIEHIGRRSGDVHLTPVHPTFIEDRVWIPVPYGEASQWAQNVLASGHCRLQFRDMVYDLDEPHLVPAAEAPLLPKIAARAAGWLGVEYLHLHVFAAHPGTLVPAAEPLEPVAVGREAVLAGSIPVGVGRSAAPSELKTAGPLEVAGRLETPERSSPRGQPASAAGVVPIFEADHAPGAVVERALEPVAELTPAPAILPASLAVTSHERPDEVGRQEAVMPAVNLPEIDGAEKVEAPDAIAPETDRQGMPGLHWLREKLGSIGLMEHHPTEAELPKVDAPEVTAKVEAALPDAEPPKFEVPHAEPPKFEMPEMTAPKPGLPAAELPKFDMPHAELPKFDMPEAPKFELPHAEPPKFEMPHAELPKVEMPEVAAPKPELPAAELPKFDMPHAELPKFDLPEPPKFDLPEPPKFDLPEAPKFELPHAEPPKVEMPEVAAPGFALPEAPKFDMPHAELPKVEMPEVAAPKPELPAAELPKFDMPHAELPKFDMPEAPKPELRTAELPKFDLPEAPKFELPHAEPPKFEMPHVEPPKFEMPEVAAPKPELPTAEPPKFELPHVEPPKFDMPEATKFELPAAELPMWDMPHTPNVDQPEVHLPTAKLPEDLPLEFDAPLELPESMEARETLPWRETIEFEEPDLPEIDDVARRILHR